ncbi:MAG: tRNA3(Ser)-specific nuclease WapA, partial [Chlamydiae bacterium]|nr:tRNA3(Ser)-specific nuclease WapA [Chlamydiota bacterium]
MRKLTFLLLYCTSLFSSSFYELDPLVSIDGCVHTLSGELYLQCEDPLTENIAMQRVYRGEQWTYFPQTKLILSGNRKEKKKSKKKKKVKKKKKKKKEETYVYDVARVADPNGCLLIYRLSGNDHYVLELPKGFTNTAQGTINSTSNLKNQFLQRMDTFTFKMTCPNGTTRVFHKVFAIGHDLCFLLQSEQLPSGQTRYYEYDEQNRVHRIRCGEENCVFQYYSDYDFDLTTSSGKAFSYRSSNNLLSSVQGEGILEEYGYAGTHLEQLHNAGQILSIEYTQDNKVRAVKNSSGELLHTFSYFTNRTEVLGSDNGKTNYYYTSNFLPETIEKPTQTIKLQWSKQGELLSKTIYDKQGKKLLSQTLSYDARGNPIFENLDGKEITREFDLQGRITKESSDKVYSFKYLGNTNLVTAKIILGGERFFYSYEDSGLLRHVSIDDGQKPTYQRNITIEGEPKWPTAIIEKASDTLLRTTLYEYAPDGVTEKVFNPDGTLCLSHKISKTAVKRPWEEIYPIGIFLEDGFEVERDFFGQMIAKRLRDESDNIISEEFWEYDALRPLVYTDASGLVTCFEYNESGQKEKDVITTSKGDIERLFSYDALGRIAKIRTGNLITFFDYDEKDRIIATHEEDLEGNLISKAFLSYEQEEILVTEQMTRGAITYSLSSLQSPDPKIDDLPGVNRLYDTFDRLIEVYTDDSTVHYIIEYNKRGQPTRIVDQVTNSEGTCTYDELGNLLEETLLNGQTLKNTYDLRGRRTELCLPDDSYIYYRWGPKYLEEIYRITQKGKYEYQHRFMQYDLAGFPTKQRLIEGFGEISYALDSNMCVAAIHSRHFDQKSTPDPKTDFITPSKPYIYKCDGLGRIVEIEQPNRVITFTYDVWNRRLTKRVKECIDKEWQEILSWAFLYDKAQEIGTIDLLQENWLRQLRVCASHPVNPGDNAIVYELEGMSYAPLYDLYGNVHKLLSVIRGKVMETYLFSQNGKEKITDIWGDAIPFSKANNPWRYGCHRIDDETGLVFIDGIYYDPNLHTFLTQP